MKFWAEIGIMAAGLGMVLITLSGVTRTQGIVLSVVSVALFAVSSAADRGNDDE